MAPKRREIGRILAKPLGIDINYGDEQKHDEYAIHNTIVDPFYESKPTIEELLLKFKPTNAGFLRYIRSLFPFLSWIFHYNLQWLMGDVVAGISAPMTYFVQNSSLISKSKVSLLVSLQSLRAWHTPVWRG